MPSFDGSDFVRIDDQATGDGTNNSTRPLDTMLEHAVRNNVQNLRQNRGRGMTWVPNSDKIWSSLQWTTFHWCFYPLKASTKNLKSTVLYKFKDPPPSEGGITLPNAALRLKAVGVSGQGNAFAQDEVRQVRGGVNSVGNRQELELSFEQEDISRQRWVVLLWQMRYFIASQDNYKSRVGATASSVTKPLYLKKGGWISKNLSGQDNLGPTGAFLFYNNQPPDGVSILDRENRIRSLELQSRFDNGGSSSPEIYITPDAYRYHNDINQGKEKAWRLVEFPEFHIKAADIREEHYDDSNITSRNISGDRPYEAQQSSFRQARSITRTYEEIKPVAMGWGGDLRAATEWARQPTMFGYQYDVPQPDDPDNLRGTIKADHISESSSFGLLEFRFFVLATFLLPNYVKGADSGFEISDLREEGGFVEFDLTIEVVDNGTTLGSSTNTYNIDLLPSDRTGRWPTLQMMAVSNFQDNDNPASTGQQFDTGSTIYTFREGGVRERELSLWNPKQQRVSLDQSTWDRSDQLEWTFDATITDFRQDPIAGGEEQNALVFSGVSIFERPQ